MVSFRLIEGNCRWVKLHTPNQNSHACLLYVDSRSLKHSIVLTIDIARIFEATVGWHILDIVLNGSFLPMSLSARVSGVAGGCGSERKSIPPWRAWKCTSTSRRAPSTAISYHVLLLVLQPFMRYCGYCVRLQVA
jgi:hypothetical protein